MTPATQARITARLSLKEAARRARVSSTYLRRIELHGDVPLVLASRLANLYNCSLNLFLFSSEKEIKSNKSSKGSSRRKPPLSSVRKPLAAKKKRKD